MNTIENQAINYRYERKFVVTELTKPQVELLIKLHPGMFSEIFYERFINNIYFDSCLMNCYFATIDGLRNRIKCRIRWYGDVLGYIEKPVLELKIKDGLVGRKKFYPLTPFSLDEKFSIEDIMVVFKNSDLPGSLGVDLTSMQLTLLNRYSRRYFQTADRNYRMTIDSKLEFYRINQKNNTFLHKSVDDHYLIVELKYNQDLDNHASRISSYFPFRVTKSSKYANGIQKIYLW